MESHCCLPTSKTKQNWWCLAHSITVKFKNTNSFTHVWNLHVHKHQKWNLEMEPNPAKLKKVSEHFILKQDKEKEINMYEALLRGNELLIPFNIISSKLSDFSYQTIKGLQALQKYSDQVNLTSTGSLPYPSFLSWLLSYAYFSFTFKTSLATYSKKSTWQVQHVTWMSVLLQIRFFPSASRKLIFLICALSGNPVDFWQT